MKEHPNFFENIKEARMRLRGTVVTYDGMPCYVAAMTEHKGDGLIRVYIEPVSSRMVSMEQVSGVIPPFLHIPGDSPQLGELMDKWLEDNPNTPIMRKTMNSPAFKRFRPFPLGMMQINQKTLYVERIPNRKVEQGLIDSMLEVTTIELMRNDAPRFREICSMWTDGFRDCVLGKHPSAYECLAALGDPEVTNDSAAFHRHFALVRGPIGTLFLAYKRKVVGVLEGHTMSSFDKVKLSSHATHLKEVVQELGLFTSIR